MSPPAQELGVGQTLNTYGTWGLVGDDIAPPESIWGMLLGEAGVGKTSLFREHPGALIINLDLHSIPKPNPNAPTPKCQFFPYLRADGRFYIPDFKRPGKEIQLKKLSWGPIEDLMDKLITAAQRGDPHPQTVVFDTVRPVIALRQRHVAVTGALGGNVYESFADIPEGNPSYKAWGYVYDGFAEEMEDLRNAGIGPWLIAHIVTERHKEKTSKGEIQRIRTTHNVPAKMHGRYSMRLEFLGGIEVSAKATKDPKTGAAKVVRVHQLTDLYDTLPEEGRARVNIGGPITLPATNAWDTFRQAYLKAANAITKE